MDSSDATDDTLSQVPDESPSNGRAAASVAEVFAEGIAARAAVGSTGAAERRTTGRSSVDARVARGRGARAETPRSALGCWVPGVERPDPVELLRGQEASRVSDLVPLRHERIVVSAFTFYRGSALVMASDLASQPRTSLTVQSCGDAHLSNFGLFGAPDRSVVFDVNDFDETHPAPFEWDVKRLATSFVLAARDNDLPAADGLRAARAAAQSYRESMASFAGKTELQIWYERVDRTRLEATVSQITHRKRRKQGSVLLEESQRAVKKARARDMWSVVKKLTEVVDGRRRFLDQPPLLERIAAEDAVVEMIHDLFESYRATLRDDLRELLGRYEVVDIAHKIVGVGSVGLLAIAVLMRGRDEDDLMILQVKEAQASVLEAFTDPPQYAHHGQRVVSGQRLMQAAGDSFLGWVGRPGHRNFYVRQLRDMKWSPDPAVLDGPGLGRYAVLCGHTLAQAHARSGDAVAISAYLGHETNVDRAIAEFARTYADQVQQDYAAFAASLAASG